MYFPLLIFKQQKAAAENENSLIVCIHTLVRKILSLHTQKAFYICSRAHVFVLHGSNLIFFLLYSFFLTISNK